MANQIENIGFQAPAPSRNTTMRDFAQIATIALVFFTVGSMSMKLAFKPEGVAAIWPGSGIFLSAILLIRTGLRPLLVGILFLIDFLIGLYNGTPFLVSLTYALSLAFDASFSAWILLKIFGNSFSFYKVRDVLGFIFMSVFLSNVLSASFASLVPFYILGLPFWHTWKLLCFSNGIGNLLFTPFILSWADFTMKKQPELKFWLVLEIAALYLSILLLNYYIFQNLSGNINFLSFVNYYTFPFLIWAALRFGVRGVSTASITLAVNILFYALTSKIAIFNNETRLDSVVLVQLYLAILSISSLILATVVSERKLASDALRNSEEQFRNFFEHSVVGKSITTLDGKLKTNQAFCQIVGYSEDELNQLKWQEITHPDDIEPNTKAINSIISGEKQSVRFEKRYIHKDGSIVWADVNTALQRDKDGEPLYFITAIIDITEHKLAEEALRESERILRESQSIARLGSYVWDLTTGLWKSSKILDEIFGIGPDYVRSQEGWAAIIHPESQKMMTDYLVNDVLGKHQRFDREYQIIRKNDREERWVHGMGELVVNADGQPLQMIGTIRDITERKQTEKALIRSEEDYRKLFENHSAIKLIIDPLTGDIHDANYSAAKYYGWSREELKKMNIRQINTLPDIEIKIAFRQSKEKIKNHFEFKHRRADGSIRDVEIFSNIISMEDREYLHAIVMDITERKQAEYKIVKANRIYAVISQINKTIVRTHDRNELFRESCRIAVEYGKFQMAWIGLADRETKLVIPFTFAGFEANYLTNINKISYDDIPSGRGPTGRSIRENTHIVCDDFENNPLMAPWREEALKRGYLSSIAIPISLFGEVIGAFTIYASVPHFFDEEETDLLVKVASDISFALEAMENEKKREEAETEIKKLNETLELRVEQRTAQLESANRELEAFSYSVSHDLRAPLRHINGFINLLLESKTSPFTSDELHYLDIVSKASDEMSKLIDALLSFSRLNRSEIHKVPVDSLHLVEQSLQIYEDEIRRREIEIEINSLHEILGDILLIGQVWTNLISNAVKYTGKTVKPRIEIGSYQATNETVFYIKDNGAGFNMKYADKLFGVFQRLHKQSDFDGIGIGLANINRIISRHGGRCWAEGEIDKGATFYFSLPDK